jgi:uncharacterized protein
MKDQIAKELMRLEQQHEIKILYAVESGSRAWGFASTDSDWDVRFIYIHTPEWYLSVDEKKDSLEEILPNDVDLAGWELRKALKLFRKSNPPLLEWLRSPIVYLHSYSSIENLRLLSNEYFNPKSCMSHYLHMGERNFFEYLQSDIVRTKKYFYVLRPILACQWIERTNSMAPMEFKILLDAELKESPLRLAIEKLLDRKRKGEELNEEPKIAIINEFLDEKINYFNHLLKQSGSSIQPDTNKLNELFRKTLHEVYGLNISRA